MQLERFSSRFAHLFSRASGRGAPSSGWLRLASGQPRDDAVKPPAYLPVYEDLLDELRDRRFTLLELGVWHGDSLAMWRDCLPRAQIVGLDLEPPDLDLGPRVRVVRGDQADAELLARLRATYAPEGFDVIIDDASHVGSLTARSLQALYPDHLRAGGLYVIEDWCTGYLPHWPDGATPEQVIGAPHLDAYSGTVANGDRMPSHDAGMVGLIKRLVDNVASGTLQIYQPPWIEQGLEIEWMRVHDGLVILKKPPAA